MNTRRGACPALFTPMQTGDGLLVRIVPADAITPTAFMRFCEAACRPGNGTIERTRQFAGAGRDRRRCSPPKSMSYLIIADPLGDDPACCRCG